MNAILSSPAHQLEGFTLQCGWTLGLRLPRPPGATGGNFCVAYPATRGNETAFVKAVDFIGAMSQANPLAALARLGEEAEWEKTILAHCGSRGMSRIVKLLDHEFVDPPGSNGDVSQRVSCLVTERGERDLRDKLNLIGRPKASWMLHALRDVAFGLDQLHSDGIVHLDIKPSNVISVEQIRIKKETQADGTVLDTQIHASIPAMKITDMARVVRRDVVGPWDQLAFPGDQRYMPPEKWYGFRLAEWRDERESADAFMLGSLMVFMFTGSSMSLMYSIETPHQFKPGIAAGFDGLTLDVLIRSQSRILANQIAPALVEMQISDPMRSELLNMMRELTHPDPRVRGDARARRQQRIGLDRYHQRLLTMAKRLELLERVQP